MRKNLDEFYVGYHERMPPATGVFFKKIIAGLLLLVAICAFVLASGQSAFYPSIFEFGVERTFEGIIVEQPYPVLLMQPSGANQNGDATSSGFIWWRSASLAQPGVWPEWLAKRCGCGDR